MTPPAAVVDALRRYDPLLRCRWGNHAQRWVIERKVPERVGSRMKLLALPVPPKPPDDLPEKLEAWRRRLERRASWVSGYEDVMFVHPSLLDERIVATLAATDSQRAGGFDKLADALDAEDAADEAAADRQVDAYVESASRDAYDRLAWMDGRRVGLLDAEAEKAPATILETPRDGYVVRERRVSVGRE